MSQTNIYILRLESGKYYIGKTNNLQQRKKEHLNGTASAWTRKYKPISVEKIIPNASSFDEDKYTKIYMNKYGIHNVRGGSYVQINLDENQKKTLTREIRGATDKCIQCGRTGHFIKNCYAKTDVSGNTLEDEEEEEEYEEDEDEEGDEEDEDEEDEDEEDEDEEDEEDEDEEDEDDIKKPRRYISTMASNHKKHSTCYRCGNSGHYSPDCYATRHIKGYHIN
jgi:hypothetical protein